MWAAIADQSARVTPVTAPRLAAAPAARAEATPVPAPEGDDGDETDGLYSPASHLPDAPAGGTPPQEWQDTISLLISRARRPGA